MFNLHPKDSLSFRVIDTNPAKGTVTVMPTFGTLIKFNIAAGAIMYVSALIARAWAEDREPVVIELDPEHDTRQ